MVAGTVQQGRDMRANVLLTSILVVGLTTADGGTQQPTAADTSGGAHAPGEAQTAGEALFLAQNQAAMDRMMAGMSVRPAGDVDQDFTAMMIPHHQGAIDMAQAELRYGHNEQLRRIAQEIVVEQQQEIAAMRLALGQPLPSSVASPDQVRPAPVTPQGPAGPQMDMQRHDHHAQ